MRFQGATRADPDEPNSSIRLLPWVFDGKALIVPGMKDARSGKPVVGQFRHPIPREAVLLAAAPEHSARDRSRNAGKLKATDYLWVPRSKQNGL